VFNGGGVAGAKFGMHIDHMTVRQFDDLWAGFGLSRRAMADYDGYYCESRGTCKVTINAICTSNC
jgi:hypothetical protein